MSVVSNDFLSDFRKWSNIKSIRSFNVFVKGSRSRQQHILIQPEKKIPLLHSVQLDTKMKEKCVKPEEGKEREKES